ncbi:hypothetical protein BDZ89DRAFT_1141117 [Hymenopellis radicata]|nr:hypothetical protein BDZ89DRAFT_1141117 [Hymenopellis radicata]
MSTIRSESPPPTTPSTPTYRTSQLETPSSAPRSPRSNAAPDIAHRVATPKRPSQRSDHNPRTSTGNIEHMVYTFTYRNPAGEVVIVDPMSLNGSTKFKGAPLHVSSVAAGSQCADMPLHQPQPVRDIFVSPPERSAITGAGFLGALLITLILGMALYELDYQKELWHAFLLRGHL